jgi:hypothetical protein
MSARSRRRRERAAALPAEVRDARSRPKLNLPLLPTLAAGAGLLLLGTAWTTRWSPGAPREAPHASRFTLQIPADQQRVINNWERFFICYDLLDPAVVDLTLRANQRATGTLDFPGDKVEVELPAPRAPGEAADPPASGAEDELLAVRRSVLGAAVPERLAAIREQCARGTPGG